MNDPRGSVWRRWDLHFHTPASFDCKYKAASAKEIVDVLLAAGVAAVAITDHHKMQVDLIEEIKELAGSALTVFPGIELRSEMGGRKCMHYGGIFPEDVDVADVWTKLQGGLGITEVDVANKGGDEKIYVRLPEGAELIRKLGGIVSVHAGGRSNSIERIGNADAFKQAMKADMVRKWIDLLEIGQARDAAGYRKIVFPEIGAERPLILVSDCHSIKEYNDPRTCWIKADTTFAGLRMVLVEPEGRVCLDDRPKVLARVAGNKTKYVKSVSFEKVPGSKLAEEWFSGQIEFGHELVGIIGNKGCGKSALADVIGLLADTDQEESFSFLNPQKFRQVRDNKARSFEATLTWEDGDATTRRLSDGVPESVIERAKYIPQNYLEQICNQLPGEGHSFDDELESVIFSHIHEADRLGRLTLRELLEYLTSETNTAIEVLKTEIRTKINELVALEEQNRPAHKTVLKNTLAQKKKELAANDRAKPPLVAQPKDDLGTARKAAKITEAIDTAAKEVFAYEEQIEKLTRQRAAFKKTRADANKLLGLISNLELTTAQFRTEATPICETLGIGIDDLVKITVNEAPLQEKITGLDTQIDLIAKSLDPENSEGTEHKRAEKEKEIAGLKANLDAPNQKYQAYLLAMKEWEAKRKLLVGDDETVDTVKYYEAQIAELDQVPGQIASTHADLRKPVLKVYGQIATLVENYRTMHKPVQQFIKDHTLAKNKFDMTFVAEVAATGFEERFLQFINQNRKGSFYGQDGRARLKQIVDAADFQTKEGLEKFLDEIEDHLKTDHREGSAKGNVVDLEQQLTRGTDAKQLYGYLCGLDYLKPRYALRWHGKNIEQLSPGERGTLLLVFYLLIDQRDITLILDQPEENLDNETVFDVLVPSIKEAKKRRQIIIVTHNPNLAVVCDAEQIIWAQLDKKANNRLTYTCGAIEEPTINDKLVDILEGTPPAFDNRGQKYEAIDWARQRA